MLVLKKNESFISVIKFLKEKAQDTFNVYNFNRKTNFPEEMLKRLK